MDEYGLIVDGEERSALDGATFESVDPSTGTSLARVASAAASDVDAAVGAARGALADGRWARLRPAERGRILWRLAELIRRDAAELAATESRDNGKPLRQSKTDVEVSARYFEFYAGVADKLMGRTIPVVPGMLDYTVREPIGVSAQIVPWNYPLQIGARGAAPALAAGCSVICKPSSEAPLTAIRLGRLGVEAGIPPGVFNVVPGRGSVVGDHLVGHPGIDQVTFTGSVETGIHVMRTAAAQVHPVVLELGGKSPNLVFADADLDAAAIGVANAIFQNAGQTCSAGSRLLVQRAAHGPLLEALRQRATTMWLGPGIEDPDMGPVISATQFERVLGHVEGARGDGARVVAGGGRPDGPGLRDGWFFEPTLLDGVEPGMRAFQEEIFGPVLTITTFDTLDEAIELANATEYGLVAGIWTRSIETAMVVAERVRSGQVYINTYGAGGGVELPFGGSGKSGFGREKGLESLDSYLQTKNVAIRFGT
jgi:aldehyde dehydrogenase (NAD+)